MCLFLDETEAKGPPFFFLRLGPHCLRDWMTNTPSPPPPTPFSGDLDRPLRACLQANF